MDSVLFPVAVIAAITAVIFIAAYFKWMRAPGQPSDPLVKIKSLIDQGILYEEEFVEVYFKVIRDEGFMDKFGEHQAEAKELLSTMIEESKGHKTLLENVKTNLK